MGRKPPKPRDLKAFMKAFHAFRAARPWERVYPDEPMGFRFPDEDEPWFVIVLGRENPIPSVQAAKGVDGLELLRAEIEEEGEGDEADAFEARLARFRHVLQIGFDVDTWRSVPPGQQSRLQRARISFRRESPAPLFLRIEDGTPTSIDADDLRRLRTIASMLCREDVLTVLDSYPAPTRSSVPVWSPSETGGASVAEWAWEEFDVGGDPELAARTLTPADPPAETLSWSEVRIRVECRLADYRASLRRDPLRLRDLYFGDHDEPHPEELTETIRESTFHLWVTEHARWPAASPTLLCELLENAELTEQERRLVEARRDAVISFFRLRWTDAAIGAVEFVDLLTDDVHALQDDRLAGIADEGVVVGAKLARLGEETQPVLLTPPLPAEFADDALDFLESQGLELTSEGIAEQPHLLGRLWEWFDRVSDPVLSSSSGAGEDALDLRQFGFRVGDPEVLMAALDEHEQLIGAGTGRDWNFVVDGRMCGFINLSDDELLVTALRAARPMELRRWIESVPGVDLLWDEDADGLDEGFDEGAGGYEPDAPLSPQILAAVQASLDAQHRAWIDLPLSALDGQTPREAAATAAGAARVTMLVRGLVSNLPDYDIDAARRRILDELGID